MHGLSKQTEVRNKIHHIHIQLVVIFLTYQLFVLFYILLVFFQQMEMEQKEMTQVSFGLDPWKMKIQLWLIITHLIYASRTWNLPFAFGLNMNIEWQQNELSR